MKKLAVAELNPGHLWLEPPVLYVPLSHNSRTTTNPHNPLYVQLRHSVPLVQECEGWWLPEVSWVRLPVTVGFSTFLYFCLMTSKPFISSVRQDALSIVLGYREVLHMIDS